MSEHELRQGVNVLHGVGNATIRRLNNLGIHTLEDLVNYFPRDWEDLSLVTTINKIKIGGKVNIRGTIQQITSRRSPRQRLALTQAIVSDATGSLLVVWFNQPYLAAALPKGTSVALNGVVKYTHYGLALLSPQYEKLTTTREQIHSGRIVPRYDLTAGLTQKQLRYFMRQALDRTLPLAEYFPATILQRWQLGGISLALEQIHFPQTQESLAAARRRLEFEEVYIMQLYAQKARYELQTQRAPRLAFQQTKIKEFVQNLPFQLTAAQRRVAWQILKDTSKTTPMNRLLEGDVGAGKTVVAAIVIYNAVLNGYQAVIMAPTTILAQQHFKTFAQLFKRYNVDVELCASGVSRDASQTLARSRTKKTFLATPATTPCHKTLSTPITIGTHSLIQAGVNFTNLGLVVIDEQHRFGVRQRQELQQRSHNNCVNGDTTVSVASDSRLGTIPHFLSMTATPIPRTVALAAYGDLDLSILNEKPRNRLPVITRLVPTAKRQAAYDFIRQHLNNGEQCLVICPLIELSDKLGVKAVTTEYELLQRQFFPDRRVSMVHGKIKPAAKDQIMQQMRQGELDILVATAVIEVGVDLPQATIMVIEGAERFGLAQLHQFRGRVGRANKQSYCLLFSEAQTAAAQARLQTLVSCNDGFKLASKDLELRGAGEIYGTKQSGLPQLKIASLQNPQLISEAQLAAQVTIKNNLLSQHAALQEKLKKFSATVHWE